MAPDGVEVAVAPRRRFDGEAFRHQAPRYDPLSGEGARKRGGRYNPRGSFPVLYLCTTRSCAVAELRRQGERLTMGLAGLLPRVLYRYEVHLDAVLDLTDGATLDHLGLTTADLVGDDWKPTQEIGGVAHNLGLPGLVTPSATGVDQVLAVFVENVGIGGVEPRLAERWESLDDLVA